MSHRTEDSSSAPPSEAVPGAAHTAPVPLQRDWWGVHEFPEDGDDFVWEGLFSSLDTAKTGAEDYLLSAYGNSGDAALPPMQKEDLLWSEHPGGHPELEPPEGYSGSRFEIYRFYLRGPEDL